MSQQVLDKDAALARVDGDLELLREIAALFQQECPEALANLRDAIDRGDGLAASSVAHGLKGSTANFGATSAVEAALKIEQLARSGRLDQLQPHLETLSGALAMLLTELQQL